jgi:hypothetical protein
MKRKCNACDKKVTLTCREHKESWEICSYCRDCKYIMDIFAWNGNWMKQYV